MRFSDFDDKMRVYEQSLDQSILPGMYMVARLDGRGFTKYTNNARFEKPFDMRFRDIMVDTTKHLMDVGFHVVYGYTESDEISLLFHPEEDAFGRKIRKYNSTLAAEASAHFSLVVRQIATFDCRMVPIPNREVLANYFVWRQEDANRNALNGWCYWKMRHEGLSRRKATAELENKGAAYKNELLFERGINYNDVPSWQKRGMGVYYADYLKEGYNPLTGEKTIAKRRGLQVDYELPVGNAYREYVLGFLDAANGS